ncbi:MAG: hypothetical protein VXW30_06305 [Candidatus Thermoplasmatota archaeon]|nr:hypothetical protein [Candidatus Thermoplasmatota archaeon]MEC7436507.1 hypothetical protein [Candidatus Thermoplasmatota archaeon]MEC7462281.1 hypothetical protein [Candidatus Thermoplasmatota archaeon]MEC7601214.1 hypothetical protein [Candidatus Thermoplasmatota archaeon]MEC8384666.1 hypothetical protein [Candidatus Thermoplasmatota archaeon]|tara:strand:- start:1149 stop:1289 length:141 start_codon:yes stop_codon:yes gene_type:complete
MATQDSSTSGNKDGAVVSENGISQSTYVFVYLLAMAVSVWIYVAFW